jgi:Trk-type K+ transport system membrane component
VYIAAYYYTVTTVTTVGYGDISGSNSGEKIFCMILMVVGVVFFSIVSGYLA